MIRTIPFLLLMVGCLLTKVYSQNAPIARGYGGLYFDNGKSLFEAEDGDLFLFGNTDSYELGHFFLVKTDENGEPIFQKGIDAGDWDFPRKASLAPDGSIFVCGELSTDSTFFDLYVAKWDEEGNLIWEDTTAGPSTERPYSVSPMPDGGCVVFGVQLIEEPWRWTDFLLIRYDPNGKRLWKKIWGTPETEYGFKVGHTPSGNILIGGASRDTATPALRPYLAELSPDGEFLWQKFYFLDSLGQTINDFQYSPEGDIYALATGITCYVLKLSPDGNLLWKKPVPEYCVEMHLTRSGEIVVTGTDRGSPDALAITKLDANGDIIWFKNYLETLGESNGASIIETRDGGYAVTGRARTDTSYIVMVLLKVSCDGEVVNFNCWDREPPSTLEIFPQPAQSEITLQINRDLDSFTAGELKVWDLNGRLILDKIPLQRGNNQIDLSKLLPGMYLFEVREGENRSIHKVIRQ